jgi:hypothetical protein
MVLVIGRILKAKPLGESSEASPKNVIFSAVLGLSTASAVGTSEFTTRRSGGVDALISGENLQREPQSGELPVELSGDLACDVESVRLLARSLGLRDAGQQDPSEDDYQERLGREGLMGRRW